MQTPEETWDKLARGLFIELRIYAMPEIIKFLLAKGLPDWSQIAFTTDDRSASHTLELGASDHNVRLAIRSGLAPRDRDPMRDDQSRAAHAADARSSAPSRRGASPMSCCCPMSPHLTIEKVWADGARSPSASATPAPVPRIDWPDWATAHDQHPPRSHGGGFRLEGRARAATTMKAAVIRPFHWHPEFYTMDLPVRDGEVQRDPDEHITKFAIVDRFSGEAKMSKMFWRGCGPATPDTALACSVAHDKHNIWTRRLVGRGDGARRSTRWSSTQGGWALVREGELAATVRFEIGGLMSCRPAEELDAEMQHLYAEARKVEWMYEPTFRPRWYPGFPERLMFATLTCAPWTWVLVAPCEQAPEGFLNVQTGEAHPVVW